MLNRRVQLLFEKDMWNKIVKSAKAQNISAGEYIRKAIKEYSESQKELVNKEKTTTPFNRFFKPRQK